MKYGYNRANVHDGTGAFYEWNPADPPPQNLPWGYERWGKNGIKFEW